MITNKGNEKQPFLQSDVFKELANSKKVVTEIQEFKDDLRVKTIYENYNGLYKFGHKFKFVLSFLTASLATIGLFFLFYIEGFTGALQYLFVGLAAIFGLSFAIGMEYAKYILSPIISKSWLRDKSIKPLLSVAYFCLIVGSIGSTTYGLIKVIDLYYVPSLVNTDDVGTEQEILIAEYQTKIAKADTAKANIDKAREDYNTKTGNNSSWIDAKVYNQLTNDIAIYESQVIELRKEKRTDKKQAETDNAGTTIEHAANKYALVWVGVAVSFICELLLITVLHFFQLYKFKTLEQLDTIQSPLKTVFNLVDNPLTELRAHLLGGNGGLVIASGVNTSGLQIGVPTPNVNNQIEQDLVTEKPHYSGAKIGFQYGQKVEEKTGEKDAGISKESKLNQQSQTLEFQQVMPHKNKRVNLDELAKIQLNIMRYEKRVNETETKINSLKQQAAIKRQKQVLKNRRDTLRYWQKKKEAYQRKVIE